MSLRIPVGLCVALALVAIAGTGAAADAALALRAAATSVARARLAAPAAVGLIVAGSAVRWGVAVLSRDVERRVRGGRTTSAYFTWILWTVAFAALSYRAAVDFGRPAGLGLFALTLRVAVGKLDLLPRLLFTGEALFGPVFPRLRYRDIEAYELVDRAAPGMACLRIQVRGTSQPVEEWLAAGEAQSVRRLLNARGVTHRPPPPGQERRPPIL